VTDLHGNESVVNQDLLGQEVGSDCSFVACAEFLVDLYNKACEHKGWFKLFVA
jgi:hypothetical protein